VSPRLPLFCGGCFLLHLGFEFLSERPFLFKNLNTIPDLH
jgi:hypothetical protein